MKFFKYIIIAAFFITACKTTKVVIETAALKKMSARKIVKKHNENIFSANTLESKIKVRYTNNRGGQRKRHTFTARLRMKKDSLIWIQGKKSVVSVFKIKITPESFSFYSLVDKVFYEGDYEIIEKMLGIEISFSQLQNLLIGKSIFEMKGKRFKSEIVENSYKLTPKEQEDLFDVFFKINPKNYKLDQMLVKNEVKNETLRIDYNAYSELKNNIIPTKMMINATKGEDAYTWIDMEVRSLKINEPLKVRYKIPSGYKRLELNAE